MCVCLCVFVRGCIYVRDKLLMPMSHCIRYFSQLASQPTRRKASLSAICLANTKGIVALTFASLNFFVLFVFVWYSFVDRYLLSIVTNFVGLLASCRHLAYLFAIVVS